jgi:uncharacterized protein YggE
MNNNFDNLPNPQNNATTGFFQDRNLKNNIGFLCIVLSIFSILRCYEVLVDINNKKNAGIQNYLNGRGSFEIKLEPNIGNFFFIVKNTEKTAKDAHQKMIFKANKIITELYEKKIDKNDIKIDSYVSRPRYAIDSCLRGNCPLNKQNPIGFEASQKIFVKIRDIKKSGEIISYLAEQLIEEISPISYEIDDIEKIKEQARAEAINLARQDAKNIAKSLGVRISKVIKFNDNLPFEDKFKKHGMIENRDDFAPVFTIIQGENGEQKLRSNVIITYQIN